MMSPPLDIEQRVALLERTSDRAADALERLSKDLHDIKSMMQQVIAMSTRVAAVEQDCSILCSDIETMKNRAAARDSEWAVMLSTHNKCEPKVTVLAEQATACDYRLNSLEETVKAAKGFAMGQLSSLVAQFLPWIIGVLAVYAVSKGALK